MKSTHIAFCSMVAGGLLGVYAMFHSPLHQVVATDTDQETQVVEENEVNVSQEASVATADSFPGDVPHDVHGNILPATGAESLADSDLQTATNQALARGDIKAGEAEDYKDQLRSEAFANQVNGEYEIDDYESGNQNGETDEK
jgi:hypothetical protein